MSADKLLTVEDLAARWSLSRRTVLKMIQSAGIPFVTIGNSGGSLRAWGPKGLRFRLVSIEAWEVAREQVHGGPRDKVVPRGVSNVALRRMGWDGIDAF